MKTARRVGRGDRSGEDFIELIECNKPRIPRSSLFSLRNIDKSYGSYKALRGISLDIYENEFLTLLGPSGCGKTTLLRLLGGFEGLTRGTMELDGAPVAGLPPSRRPVNTVFQSYALFPHMTVTENVAFGLRRQKLAEREIKLRTGEMLRLIRLEQFAHRYPSQLSGGQQQRVALARALAPHPRLLLLDEPMSALDLKLRREMQIELKRIQRETAITFVLVTHDQEEALAMSDRIAVMKDGEMLQVGRPEEIYQSPRSKFVAEFVGEANIFAGDACGIDSCWIGVRPEHVVLAPDRPEAGLAIVGAVRDLTYLGTHTLYVLDVPGCQTVRALHEVTAKKFEIGQSVFITCKADHLLRLED